MSSRFFKPNKQKIYLALSLFILNIMFILLTTISSLSPRLLDFIKFIVLLLSYPAIFLVKLLIPVGLFPTTTNPLHSFVVWVLFLILDVLYIYVLSNIIYAIYKTNKPKKRKNAARLKRKKKVKKRQKTKKKV